MHREHRARFTWILAFLVAASNPCFAKSKKKPAPPPPPPRYPESIALRTGYAENPHDDICCQSRILGWTKDGLVATWASTYSPDEEKFRYGIDLHDPAFLDPEGIFAEEFFAADDTLPEGCAGSKEPMRCVWKKNEKEIGETLRKYGVATTDVRMRSLPKIRFETIPDPLPDELAAGSVAVNLSDSAGLVTLGMSDTVSRGAHLSPIGTIVRNRPKPARYMVLRFYSRETREGPAVERGVRLLRMPGL